MKILALYFGHDANCCFFEDGVIKLHLEKERVTRIKHDQGEFWAIIKKEMDNLGWEEKDIDMVVYNPYVRPTLDGKSRYQFPGQNDYTKNKEYMVHRLECWPDNRVSENTFYFPWNPSVKIKAYAVDHHLAHIAGAYFQSPFDKAMIMSSDGGGDRRYAAVAWARGGKITGITYDFFTGKEYENYRCLPLNIGSSWASIGEGNFGWKRLEGAGKLMGLSSYGDKERNIFIDALMSYMSYGWVYPFPSPLWGKRVGLSPDDQFAKDLATSLQTFTQVTYGMEYERRSEGVDRNFDLCLTGGVAMNCVLNSYMAEKHTERGGTFVPAQPHDGGLSVGMALYAWHQILGNKREPVYCPETPFLGHHAGMMPILYVVDAVKALEKGKIVAVIHGRAESGPRALGHRSILADPRLPDIKDRINNQVKQREWFRPFAPAMLSDRLEDYYNNDWGMESPYMSFTFHYDGDNNESLPSIPGVVHVDKTSRVQTVNRCDGDWFSELLIEWERKTECPILLNTSFNIQEPIVDTVEQARATFDKSGIDVLITPEGIYRKGK